MPDAIIAEEKWTNNFSFHRNNALKLASGDWVLSIDADEELVLGVSPDEFRQHMQVVPLDVGILSMRLFSIRRNTHPSIGLAPRLFRRKSTHWEWALHEMPFTSHKQGFTKLMHIVHHGYNDISKDDSRRNRNESILLKTVADERKGKGKWLKPRTYRYLIQTYFAFDEFPKAFKWAEEFHDSLIAQKQKLDVSTCFCVAHNYLATGKLDLGKKWIEMGMRVKNTHIDINYTLYSYGLLAKDKLAIIAGGTKYIDAYHKLEHDPTLLAQDQVMTMHPTRYADVATNLFVMSLDLALGAMGAVGNVINAIPEEQSNEIRELIAQTIAESGIRFDEKEQKVA
jgi:hypothetical protein